MADRVGVILKGGIVLVERKDELMRKLGRKMLVLELQTPLSTLPAGLDAHNLVLSSDGKHLTYTFDARSERTGITALLNDLRSAGVTFSDLRTEESSLEDIFVDLVKKAAQ